MNWADSVMKTCKLVKCHVGSWVKSNLVWLGGIHNQCDLSEFTF